MGVSEMRVFTQKYRERKHVIGGFKKAIVAVENFAA